MGEEDYGLELEEPRMTEMGKKSLLKEDGWLEPKCQGMELSFVLSRRHETTKYNETTRE